METTELLNKIVELAKENGDLLLRLSLVKENITKTNGNFEQMHKASSELGELAKSLAKENQELKDKLKSHESATDLATQLMGKHGNTINRMREWIYEAQIAMHDGHSIDNFVE
jgi:predicted nuclease with TOPRIM domain